MDSLEARLEALERERAAERRERAAEKRSLRLWKAAAALAVAGALCFGLLQPASTQTNSYTLTAPASVRPGTQVSVAWTAPANATYFDWIGLFKAGDPSSAAEVWYSYTGGTASGSATLTAPSAEGEYQLRYFSNNSRTEMARSATVAVTAASSVEQRLAAAESRIASQQAKITALEDRLVHFSRQGNEIYITGANLNIRNGLGATNGNPAVPQASDGITNGLGNLIIGYNEGRHPGTGQTNDRNGSHNLVLGREQNFTSYAGLIAGRINNITAPFATVTGGEYNTGSGWASSVLGGQFNTASAAIAAVSGGLDNEASGAYSSVSGGWQNKATSRGAHVSGGLENTASGDEASVSGGVFNTASGGGATVSGGVGSQARGPSASVSGGYYNLAAGDYSSVGGGKYRQAVSYWDWVAGSLFQDQ